MITLIKEIPHLKTESAAYTKICCGAAAYSNYEKIALFWKQTDDSEKITALISLIDNVMTLFNIDADISELTGFIKCISPKGIFTDIKTADFLNLKIETPCDTLVCHPPFMQDGAAENTCAGLNYAIDTVAERLYIGNREVFKADLSHRIRHDCATFVTTDHSAAFVLYSEHNAIISGISVKPVKEKSGIGTATLKRLLLSVRDRPVFVCAEEKNTPFYLKNGFTILEKCAYCRL